MGSRCSVLAASSLITTLVSLDAMTGSAALNPALSSWILCLSPSRNVTLQGVGEQSLAPSSETVAPSGSLSMRTTCSVTGGGAAEATSGGAGARLQRARSAQTTERL